MLWQAKENGQEKRSTNKENRSTPPLQTPHSPALRATSGWREATEELGGKNRSAFWLSYAACSYRRELSGCQAGWLAGLLADEFTGADSITQNRYVRRFRHLLGWTNGGKE